MKVIEEHLRVIAQALGRVAREQFKRKRKMDHPGELEAFDAANTQRFFRAFEELLAIVRAKEHAESNVGEEELLGEIERAAAFCAREMKSAEAFLELSGGQTSLACLFGFSRTTMALFYQIGYRRIKEGQLDRSADLFWLLAVLDPMVHSYWLGLGIAEQMREKFNEALFAYAMATFTDETDPIPQCRSAQCYSALGDGLLARNALEIAIEQCGADMKYGDLKRWALAFKEQL